MNPMKRQINRSTTIALSPLDADDTVSGPYFAINWFDTRAAWLYDLYNLLAVSAVRKAGGKPLFKGTRSRTLVRSRADDRDRLLIVRYPSGEAFLDLLQNRTFQLTSVLRILAVENFSFLLHARSDTSDASALSTTSSFANKHYALHHFRSSRSFAEELERAKAITTKHDVGTFFASEAAVLVSAIGKHGRSRDLPFLTHKLFLFEAHSEEALERAFGSSAYESFLSELDTSYIAFIERTF